MTNDDRSLGALVLATALAAGLAGCDGARPAASCGTGAECRPDSSGPDGATSEDAGRADANVPPGTDGGGDPCASITCSGHGTCAGGACACESGYHAAGISCIPDGTSDLCAGLITDTSAHPMTPRSPPAVGTAYVDAEFHTTIRRITDVGGTDAIAPIYSPNQAWNADESYLLLYHVGRGHELYDGHTYARIRDVDVSPPDVEQVYWSTTDPDILFWIDGNVVNRYRVSTNASEPIHTISECPGQVGADSHAWISWDANVLALRCEDTGSAFIYRIDTGTVLGMRAGSGAPSIGATGTLAYWNGDVVDTAMRTVRTLDLSETGEHSSLGMLANGHDTYNLVQFDPSAHVDVGSLVTYDMTDGSARVIVGPETGYPYPPSGTHISAPIYRRPGWVFVSIIGDASGSGPLDQELLLVDTNPGGAVCRIGHHHSQEAVEYWGEPHVSGSPSGTRAIFGSDWGGGSVDTYVVELPAYAAP